MSDLQEAVFYADVAQAPEGTKAYWLKARDGVRLRMSVFPADGAEACKGTVLIFPGRTEYVEKYGPVGAELAARGYTSLAIDWRGQGLADRLLDDRAIGHVGKLTDYQMDVDAVVQAAEALDLPRPWFLIGHSMGGGIGLRSLMEGLDVKAAVWTGPMFGISLTPGLRILAHSLSWSTHQLGMGHVLAPTQTRENYAMIAPFEENKLTSDREMFDFLRMQGEAHPDLLLGGPSLNWLREALMETAELRKRPSPALPCLCFMGSNERIADWGRVRERMARWPMGRLEVLEGGEHEVMMQEPSMRSEIFDKCDALFCEAAAGEAEKRRA